MPVCRLRQSGGEALFCPTNGTDGRATDRAIIYIGVAETVPHVPRMGHPAEEGTPRGGGFIYLKNECVIEARRENKWKLETH